MLDFEPDFQKRFHVIPLNKWDFVVVDKHGNEVVPADGVVKRLHFTDTELNVLKVLAETGGPGNVAPNSEVVDILWPGMGDFGAQTLRRHVSSINVKAKEVSGMPFKITRVKNVGYNLISNIRDNFPTPRNSQE